MSDKKETVTVVDDVAPDTDEEYTYTFPSGGTLTDIAVSTYSGHEFDLQYTFELAPEGETRVYNLMNPLGFDYLAGNGEVIEPVVRREFEKGDQLIITVRNQDTNYTYHANARVGVDYNPASRFLSEVFG